MRDRLAGSIRVRRRYASDDSVTGGRVACRNTRTAGLSLVSTFRCECVVKWNDLSTGGEPEVSGFLAALAGLCDGNH
jgi:hypothetical protein